MKTVTTFYLVRHGETDWNASERCQGSLDIPMNDAGRRQAQQAGEAVRHLTFDAAYTSSLGRAQETAAAILGPSPLTATRIPELAELSYGAWHGLRPSEWPDESGSKWRRDPWSMRFPEGESLVILRDRVIPVFERIVREHLGQRILVATHGHVNRLMLIHALGSDPETFWEIEQANGAVFELELVHEDGKLASASARQLFPKKVNPEDRP